MDYNKEEIDKRLKEQYALMAKARNDKGLEQVIAMKEEYDEDFRAACIKEYINRQNKLS